MWSGGCFGVYGLKKDWKNFVRCCWDLISFERLGYLVWIDLFRGSLGIYGWGRCRRVYGCEEGWSGMR